MQLPKTNSHSQTYIYDLVFTPLRIDIFKM